MGTGVESPPLLSFSLPPQASANTQSALAHKARMMRVTLGQKTAVKSTKYSPDSTGEALLCRFSKALQRL
jgi:hypothetical protein